jgi:hypothetical protein
MNNKTIYKKDCMPFTRVSHDITHLNDLNVIEIGLITSLLSNTPDWIVYKENEQRKSGIGRQAFDKAWNTLVKKGFIFPEKLKEQGRICYSYTIYAIPRMLNTAATTQPAEKCVQKTADSKHASNKEVINKKIKNKEKKNKEKKNENTIINENINNITIGSEIPMEIDITSIKLSAEMGREEKIEIIDNVFNVEKRFNELGDSIDFDTKIELLLSMYNNMTYVLNPIRIKKEVFTDYHTYRNLKKEGRSPKQIFYRAVESTQLLFSDSGMVGKILV